MYTTDHAQKTYVFWRAYTSLIKEIEILIIKIPLE